MKHFPSITLMYQTAKYVDATNANPKCPEKYKIRKPVRYKGTVKLDGSNVGVTVVRDEVSEIQSRDRVIVPGDDLKGFAKFVREKASSDFVEIADLYRRHYGLNEFADVTIFGEWCGAGVIQGKSAAVSLIPEKSFVHFGAYIDSTWCGGDIIKGFVPTVPFKGVKLESLSGEIDLEGSLNRSRIFHIDEVQTFDLMIDWNDPESVKAAAEVAGDLTHQIETECPWAKRFGISGVGEGIVWMPQGEYFGREELAFKTKGEKHSKVKGPKVQLDPVVVEGVEAFVEFALPETRLEQGLDVLAQRGLTLDTKNIGAYLRWVSTDVEKECALDLQASGLEWKNVVKGLQKKARDYFLAKVK